MTADRFKITNGVVFLGPHRVVLRYVQTYRIESKTIVFGMAHGQFSLPTDGGDELTRLASAIDEAIVK